MKTKIQKYETRDQLYVSAQESNEKLMQINQLRLKPAITGSRMVIAVSTDSPEIVLIWSCGSFRLSWNNEFEQHEMWICSTFVTYRFFLKTHCFMDFLRNYSN